MIISYFIQRNVRCSMLLPNKLISYDQSIMPKFSVVLKELSGISTASMAKLGKGDNITTDVFLRICTALNCQISDILKTLPDEETKNNEE